jgi:glycerophosphoryl diester phosphodiesterase
MRPKHTMSQQVRNIAHRGASGAFPENTLAAFRSAIEAGAEMCELDVQLTRDRAVVVMHDDTVDRTTDGHGAVGDFTLAELKRLDAGARRRDSWRTRADAGRGVRNDGGAMRAQRRA